MREEIRKLRRNQGSLHGDFPEIWPLYCDHSVTSADARLGVGVEMFGIRRQEKKVSGTAASAETVTISLVTNRKHAARMALQKRFSKIREQFVDCIRSAVKPGLESPRGKFQGRVEEVDTDR